MDSGGLRLIEQWINDCITQAASHIDYIVLLVQFLHTLPEIAVAERNIGTTFFEKALLPLAKSLRTKETKHLDGFKSEHKKLQEHYAIVYGTVQQRERERERELAEEEAKAAALRLVEQSESLGSGSGSGNGEEVEDDKEEEVMGTEEELPPDHDDGVFDDEASEEEILFTPLPMPSSSTTALSDPSSVSLSRSPSPSSTLRDLDIDFIANLASGQSTAASSVSASSTPLSVTISRHDDLDDTLESLGLQRDSASTSASATASPRQTSSSASWPAVPHIKPVLPVYDHTTEYRELKSILKKSSTVASLEVDNLLVTSSSKNIQFSEEEDRCTWFGGPNCYYRWVMPHQRDPIITDKPPIEVTTTEYHTQEQRLFSVSEYFTTEDDSPDNPGMVLSGGTVAMGGGVHIIPWMPNVDETVTNDGNDRNDGIINPVVSVEQNSAPLPVPVPVSIPRPVHYHKVSIVPGLTALVRNSKNNIYIAIWNHAFSVIRAEDKNTIQISQLGCHLSSKFGKKYLTKCPGKNLKQVLLSHPEGKFHLLASNLIVGASIVASDIWMSTKDFLDTQKEAPVVLLKDVRAHLMREFRTFYTQNVKALEYIKVGNLTTVLDKHPLTFFEIYQCDLVSGTVCLCHPVAHYSVVA